MLRGRFQAVATALGIVAALGAISPGRAAQVPPNPEFEVASIKPNNSGGRGSTMGVQPGRYTATNVTLRALILNAYHLESVQLSGGPAWIGADHFDIVAKIPADVPPSSLPEMLRALLADRFKLVTHTQSRQLPIYALVPARSDKKLGPQLHPSTSECEAAAGESTLKAKEGKEKSKEARGSAPAAPRSSGQRPPCTTRMAPGRLSGSAMTMPALAGSLSGAVERTVLDRTGIMGAFDVELTWTPDQMPQRSAGADPSKAKPVKVDPNGPSIFTALREQLGLKLGSSKGAVDVLVVDRVERPTRE